MADSDASMLVTDAIQDGRLRLLLSSLDGADEPEIADVRRAVEQIDAVTASERGRLGDAFARCSVESAVIVDTVAERPLIIVRADVAHDDADVAVSAAESIGYRRLAPTAAGAWRAYRHFYGGCTLVDDERDERRIELSWRARRTVPAPWSRLVVPGESDFDAVDLPRRWWFGYVIVHVARLPLRRWRRRSEPVYLGPFLVTPATLVPPLLRFADARPGVLVVDLGCGDGRILVEAAAMGCRARGVESDARLVARSRASVAAAGVDDRVEVVHGDATSADLSDADIVVMFLPVSTLRELLPEVLERLRPGARLVVHEQERLDTAPAPSASAPITSPDGVTVAHRWDR